MSILCGVAPYEAPDGDLSVTATAIADAEAEAASGRNSWFISTSGELSGTDTDDGSVDSSDESECISSGQVLTMQLNTDEGTLKFFVNGRPNGLRFTQGVVGPVRWATSVAYKGNSVRIVSNPQLQYGL